MNIKDRPRHEQIAFYIDEAARAAEAGVLAMQDLRGLFHEERRDLEETFAHAGDFYEAISKLKRAGRAGGSGR